MGFVLICRGIDVVGVSGSTWLTNSIQGFGPPLRYRSETVGEDTTDMLKSKLVTNLTRRALRRIGKLGYTPIAFSQTQGEQMPDTGIATDAEQESPSRSIATDEAVADSPSDRVDDWHEHLASHGGALHGEMIEAREILHMGTPADAIELANRDVPREASEAAARWQTSTHA
jgi:hypothetical protein